MFRDVDVIISGVKVNPVTGLYPYIPYLLTILGFSSDTRRVKAERFGYSDASDPSLHNAGTPGSFATRVAYTARSAQFEFNTPIFGGVFMQPRPLLPLIGWSVNFQLEANNLALLTRMTDQQYTYRLRSAKLYIEKLTCIESFSLELEKKLLKANASYLVPNWKCSSWFIPASCSSFAIADIFAQTFTPEFCYIGLTLATEAQGSQNLSRFNFRPHNISSVRLYQNGHCIPSVDWGLNFPNHYLLAWLSLFSGATESANFEDSSGFIDRGRYLSGYTLYRLDLNSSRCRDSLKAKSMTPSRLEINFHVVTNPALRVYLLSYSTETLYIESSRAVIKNY